MVIQFADEKWGFLLAEQAPAQDKEYSSLRVALRTIGVTDRSGSSGHLLFPPADHPKAHAQSPAPAARALPDHALAFPDETVIDGEVVALDESGRPSFKA